MPRLQTPKGYYTAKEVKGILNVSDSMIRQYAQRGIIGYSIPPGRKQGFYLKSDVDKLANELNAYLSIASEEKDSITFHTATREDMRDITKMGRMIFDPSNTDYTPHEWHLNALEKNPEISFVLRKGSELLGYINTVPFTIGNQKAKMCLQVEYLRDVNITPEDIETYDTGKHIHLYIMAVCTSPELKASERKWYGSQLVGRFITFLESLAGRGVVIEVITARGDSRSGVKLLQAFGFTEIEPPLPGKRAFKLNIDESYGYIATQYKEALAEYGQGRHQQTEEH